MDASIDKLIHDFIEAIAVQNKKFVTAYLFGSYVKGKQREESDIDIALVIDKLTDKDKFDTQVQLMMLASQFDSRIEPHPISRHDFGSSNPFAMEIKKTGIEIMPSKRII